MNLYNGKRTCRTCFNARRHALASGRPVEEVLASCGTINRATYDAGRRARAAENGQRIARMHASGLSLAEIGRIEGVTLQRIWKVVHDQASRAA